MVVRKDKATQTGKITSSGFLPKCGNIDCLEGPLKVMVESSPSGSVFV